MGLQVADVAGDGRLHADGGGGAQRPAAADQSAFDLGAVLEHGQLGGQAFVQEVDFRDGVAGLAQHLAGPEDRLTQVRADEFDLIP